MLRIKGNSLAVKAILLAFIFAAVFPVPTVRATYLSDASLALGNSQPNATGVTYTINANSFSTGTTINCIQLQLNTASDMSAGAPIAMDTSAMTLDSSSLITSGSWSEDVTPTNGTLEITFAGGETPAGNGNIVFGGIANGDTADTTYFAELRTYSNTDCSTGGPVDNVIVAFVYIDGEQVQLTVDPTLTLVCNGVASGQTVNGATTTLATNCTGVDFGTSVNTTTNGVSAHDLDVTTNASGGYAIYIRNTSLLTNAFLDTISSHTGTNAAPTAFPGAGTEAWGYTTQDATLSGGTANRFTSAGGFAGFNTTNEVVADFASTTSGTQTTRIGHQVGVATGTDAGTYQTTIIYTLVATY